MLQDDGDELPAQCADSVQKLNLLLFLHEHPGLVATADEIASQFYIGSPCLARELLAALEGAGLVECNEGRCRLSTEPQVESCLHQLTRQYDNPVTRQKILPATRTATSRASCLDRAHEPRQGFDWKVSNSGSVIDFD